MYSTSASKIRSFSHFGHNLTVCLEIWKIYVTKNCNVTANLFWNGIATRNLVSFFTIYGLTKFISSSKPVGAIGWNFLYCPLYSWNFKSAHKLVPLYTDLFLYNSVCHQRLSRRFLLLDNMRYTNMKAAASCLWRRHLPTRSVEHWRITAHSPFARMGAAFSENKPQDEQNPRCYVTLLHCI
jgi:hypothetical protein